MIEDRAVHLALTYLETGRPEQALEELAPLIASKPDSPELLVLGAQAAALVGALDRARELADRAVAIAPEDVSALIVKSQVDAVSGRSVQAARAAVAAVRIAPHDWRTHAQVVRVDLAAAAVYRTTIAACGRMLALASDRPEAQVVAGRLAAARHRRRAAAEHFRAALAIDPTNGGAQEGLALLAAGRLRFAPAVETASSRLASDPTDRVGKRLLEAMTLRLVLPAVVGPPFIAFAIWRGLRTSDIVPPGVVAERTIAGDYPWLLLLPAALVAWLAVQAVLLHRASGGSVWQDLRELPGRGIAILSLVLGALTLVSMGVLAGAPVSTAKPILLVEVFLCVAAFVVPLIAGGATLARLRGRGRLDRDAELRVEHWTGLQTIPPSQALPKTVRSGILVGFALLAGPAAPAGALWAARGANSEEAYLFVGRSLLESRPLTGGAIVAAVLAAVLLLAGANALSAGAVWPWIRRSRWFGAVVAAVTVDVLTVGASVWAVLQPVGLGGAVVAMLLIVWALIGCVCALMVSRRQRLARRG